MNYKILSKVLEQLNNEKPDISYIKGMIETLIAMQPDKVFEATTPVPMPLAHSHAGRHIFKESIGGGTEKPPVIDAGRIPNLESIKDMVNKSLQTEN